MIDQKDCNLKIRDPRINEIEIVIPYSFLIENLYEILLTLCFTNDYGEKDQGYMSPRGYAMDFDVFWENCFMRALFI